MTNIKCPHCNTIFNIDDTELNSLINQIRDKEFNNDVNNRINEISQHMEEKHSLEITTAVNEAVKQTENELLKEIQKLKEDNTELKNKLDSAEKDKELELMKLAVESEKSFAEKESAYTNERTRLEILLNEKEKEVEFYKDLKSRMSTKMVGETLEQHCEIEFNKLRMTAFKNAYFEKDNEVSKSGSKGDYIYREYDENGIEIISIMFEMKNEMETTEKKHKNEDFFKELDKDRNEKECEYAVLVSTLEADSELYNAGIVDVSYRYNKMYVVRPQCFIPIITLLRNASLNALQYKQELAIVRSQNIDVTNFETNLMSFKDAFSKNYQLAHKHFNVAIDEIDKTIDHLQKVKDALLKSDNQYRIANDKVEDVSIKKLTKNAPLIAEKIEEQRKNIKKI